MDSCNWMWNQWDILLQLVLPGQVLRCNLYGIKVLELKGCISGFINSAIHFRNNLHYLLLLDEELQ